VLGDELAAKLSPLVVAQARARATTWLADFQKRRCRPLAESLALAKTRGSSDKARSPSVSPYRLAAARLTRPAWKDACSRSALFAAQSLRRDQQAIHPFLMDCTRCPPRWHPMILRNLKWLRHTWAYVSLTSNASGLRQLGGDGLKQRPLSSQ